MKTHTGRSEPSPGADPSTANSNAFALLELLVVLTLFVLLAGVIVPAQARTKPASQGVQCLVNKKRVMVANLMYQADNADNLPMVLHGAFIDAPTLTSKPWIGGGWLDWTTGSDNTNQAFLVEPRYSCLADYTGRNKDLFRCPADVYVSRPQSARGWTTRVRSVSANVYVGKGNAWNSVFGGPGGPNNLTIYKGAAKSTDLLIPGPARTWVYMDEHPDSINDGGSFAPASPVGLVDAPATYHGGAAGFAMADGHAEIHRWVGPLMNKPRPAGFSGVSFSAQFNFSTIRGDPDLFWLSFATPRWTTRTVAD